MPFFFRNRILPKQFIFSLSSCLIGLSSFSTGPVHAAIGEAQDFTIHQHWMSTRALGMGNAFVALADDYNALFYNPAGLARIQNKQISLGVGAQLDSKIMKLQSDLSAASGANDGTAINDLLEQNYGSHYSLRAPTLSAFWARPGWAMAVIATDPSIEMSIHRAGPPMLNVIGTQDTTIAYGQGWDVNWGTDRVSLGVTGKAIYRAYFNRSLLATDLIDNSEILRPGDAMEGLTLDFDFGLISSPKTKPKTWWQRTRPTVGFNVRNVADYGFKQNFHLFNKESGEPPRIGRRFDVGALWELPDWWIFKTRGMVDMRDMGHANWSPRKGLHMGFEFNWKVASWWQGGWRIGINQGYPTAGFTGKFGIFNLDLATYGEETGPSDAPKASRRYALNASLDW